MWTLRAGEDYDCADVSLRNAAYAWTRRRDLIATCSVPEPGVVQIAITRKRPPAEAEAGRYWG